MEVGQVGVEIEDDLYFADLSKQISLLIMDDDDPVAKSPVSFQGFPGPYNHTAPSPFLHGQSCMKESKGTGVFIPESSQPRRKQRQRRFSSFNTKSKRKTCIMTQD